MSLVDGYTDSLKWTPSSSSVPGVVVEESELSSLQFDQMLQPVAYTYERGGYSFRQQREHKNGCQNGGMLEVKMREEVIARARSACPFTILSYLPDER